MNNSILTLVTFIPAIGAVLLMLMPRNDRALRWAALIISLVAFAFSLYLPLIWALELPPQGSSSRQMYLDRPERSTFTIILARTASPCG